MYSIPVWRGFDGASAYQLWLAAGNTGTQEEFLASLQGELAPEDRVRVDAAIETAETINARIGEATEAAEIATEAAEQTDADAQAVEAGRQQAVQAAGDAEAARQAAEAARLLAEQQRQAAEAAAVAAALLAGYYDTIAAGRAAVADGDTFAVRASGPDGLARPTIYRRDSATTQTAMVTIVNPSEVDAEFNERRSLIRFSSMPGYVLVLNIGEHSTALRLRESDGDFDDPVVNRWGERLTPIMGIDLLVQRVADEIAARSGLIGYSPLPPGLLGTQVIRHNGEDYPTWNAVTPNGGMPDFSARYIAERVSPYLNISGGNASILPTDMTVAGGELAPILPDMTRMAGWGSSTMEYMGAEVAAEMAALGVSYYNGGDAGVRAEHTLAQLGSHPALISGGVVIPATGPVNVSSSNVRATTLLKPFAGTLAGVEGTLSSTATSLVFTRASDGDPVTVPAGRPFIPTIGPQYRNAVNILNIGKNDIGSAGADTMIINRTAEAFMWLTPLVKRVIVMSHCVNRDTADDSPARAQIMAIRASFAQEYKHLHFDAQGYMCSPQIWVDAEITPTQADLEAQARGNKAPSLSLDDLHFNAAGDRAFAKALRRFVLSLIWYKEPTA
ncbi:hypothetical protein [Paracoccus yeei]|uniref:Uncharacterized protein n=1 Tax=Paracoccus yeei TaxID=147645 RepID=A0A5P2QUK7_9RHOB|nr:hypothetical protein [Paracoccus yeei]QEU09059.1 hypothetical protein FOB51_14215 [Paracoccus yeei]